MSVVVIFLTVLLAAAGGTSAELTHVVQPGDTLYGIAQGLDVCWEALAQSNGVKNPSLLQVGTVLVLPGNREFEQGEAFSPYTEAEHLLLARLIHAEARGESLEGQIAVGAVVLNRVKDSGFPNTIREVIYQPGQFSPATSGRLPSTPNAAALEAAARALAGEDPSRGALFFYNPRKTATASFWATRQVVRQIGNHNFAL